mgnify:CR=1 FL=1
MAIEFGNDSIQNCTILIVDDVNYNCGFLKAVYAKHGFKNVITANDGEEALIKTIDNKPDIVLLDLIMPKMDGFEYCAKVRSNKECVDIPILVQSGFDDGKQKQKAFDVGVTDFVSKPIDPDELIARTKIHLERRILIENFKEYKNRVQEELEEAKIMQNVIMPSRDELDMLEKNLGVSTQGCFRTSSELGGDFWGVIEIDKCKLGAYQVDFAGHGVTAALNTFRLHAMIVNLKEHAANPGSFMSLLNAAIEPIISVQRFATMFYGVIDLKKDKLFYATAATPNPVLFNQNKSITINGSGFPLGVVKRAKYETRSVDFNVGDTLALYSDAVIETPNKNGDFFDEKMLHDYLVKSLNKTNNIKKVFKEFITMFDKSYSLNLEDDLTVNFFTRN